MKQRSVKGKQPKTGIYLGSVAGKDGAVWYVTARNWTSLGNSTDPDKNTWGTVELKAWRKQKRIGPANVQLLYIPSTGNLRRTAAAGQLVKQESQALLDGIISLAAGFDHVGADGKVDSWDVWDRTGRPYIKVRVDFQGEPGPSQKDIDFDQLFG